MENSEAIILNDVTKIFKLSKPTWRNSSNQKSELVAIENISFSVKKGEMIGVIGLNGSGKTTLLRIIAGIYRPTSGKVETHGKIAPVLSIGTGFNNELDARDNVISYGMFLGLTKNQIKGKVNEIIEFAELEKFARMRLGQYSTGMRARLAFSIVLQIDPDILLVDEVLAVGDRVFKEKSYHEFLKFKQNKKTIVYTTHNLDKISDLSDRVLLMHKGKMDMVGDPKEVIERYKEIAKIQKTGKKD